MIVYKKRHISSLDVLHTDVIEWEEEDEITTINNFKEEVIKNYEIDVDN